MNARTIAMRIGVLALAATQLWCADSDDPMPPPPSASDGGVDSGAPEDAARGDGDAQLPDECTDAFCRVTLPDAETVALDGVWVKSASEIWIVGSNGYAARFDGTSWRKIATGTKSTIFAVAGSGDGTVWGVSGGQFLSLDRDVDGGVEAVDASFKGIVRAVATFGQRDAWAVGNTFPSFFEDPPPPSTYIWRYAPAADGSGYAWQAVSPPCPEGEWGQPKCVELRAVWAESAERQWFAGSEGKIFRTDASGSDAGGSADPLTLVEMNSSSLRRLDALWGSGANDIWAVGAQGVIRHYTGGDAWTVVPSPVTEDLHGVWGSRADDVWAVGDDGVVLHWDGTAWSVIPTPYGLENRPRLYAVAGVGTDVWIAGEGTLLRSKAVGIGGDR